MNDRDLMITIDPGVKYFAYAVWSGQGLLESGRIEPASQTRLSLAHELWELVCQYRIQHDGTCRVCVEGMSVREQMRAAWRNVVNLAEVGGFLLGYVSYPEIETGFIPANEWTGGRPKGPNQHRIRVRCKELGYELPDDHYTNYTKREMSDILDAVGIGLYLRGEL